MMTGNYLISLLDISKGYFLYDIYYMIRYDKKNIITYVYIYHHLATLCCLYRNIPGSSLVLLLGELSNLPTYMVYHTIKTDKKNTKKTYLLQSIKNNSNIKIEYLELRNKNNLSPIFNKKNLKLFMCFYIKKVRLIDNF